MPPQTVFKSTGVRCNYMYLKFSDDDEVYSHVKYDAEEKCFCVISSKNVRLKCENYLKLNVEENVEDYCFNILNTDILNRENDIFQVYDKQANVRLGWIFPIQALLSDEHDYAENTFFLKYAYIAIYLLLNNLDEENMRKSSEVLKITDFYSEDAIIFVLCKSNCKQINDFCYEDYIVDLFGHGYSCLPYSAMGEKDVYVEKRINIRRISKDVKEKIFIGEVFKSLLVQTDLLPLAKFHMLYQIIELLIGDIFSYEFTIFSKKISEDTNNLFDLKDELQKLTGEKYRVKELFNTYSRIDRILKDKLMDVCNEILKEASKKEKVDVGDSLYSVRCLVFHNYGSIPSEARELIKDINEIFEKVVIELLITFNISCLK